jgi:hypothetical protein
LYQLGGTWIHVRKKTEIIPRAAPTQEYLFGRKSNAISLISLFFVSLIANSSATFSLLF